MKVLFKEIINFFFILLLLPFCLLIFFSKYKRIANSDLVIYHKNGGFGHSFTAQDLIRYIFLDKKIIYLQFYDSTRFNKYLNKIFNNQIILIPTVIFFPFLRTKFGEYEGSFFSIIEKIIIFFLKKKMSIEQFYAFIERKYVNYKIKRSSPYKYLDIYFFLLKKKKLNLNLDLTSNKYKFFKGKKLCTIYLRQKYSVNDFSNSIRSGSSDPKVYFNMIDHLIKKNYIIYLVGEDIFTIKDVAFFKGKIMDYRSLNLEKKYFQIYASVHCDLFISEAGGGHWFGVYAKKSVLINCLPYGYKPFNFKKILYKKVVDRNNIVMSYKKANKNFYLSYEKIKNYKVINNSSKELLKIAKSVV
jgi:putative glycosyltransferase (TIGR04372 family)